MWCWIRCGVLVTSLSFGLAAQDMPYPVGYTYVAMAESGGPSVTATSVVNTNCTAGHTVPNVTVNLYNPGRTRSAYAYNSAQYCYAQATAYLPLCPATGCEDGTFEADNEGTIEYCPIAAAYVAAVAALSQRHVDPYVYLRGVSWNPTSVPAQNGRSRFYVEAGKSYGCTATSVTLSVAFFPMPTEIQFSYLPAGAIQSCSPSPPNYSCAVSWEVTTSTQNTKTGRIGGDGRLEGNDGGCVNKEPVYRSADLSVQ